MRKLLATFLALMLVVTGLGPVAAQESDTAFGAGLNTQATWFNERGRAMATLEVTGIQEEWTGYDNYSAPDPGVVYRGIEFTITNVSGGNMIIEPYDFSLIDSEGRNMNRAWVSEAEDNEQPLFSEDTALAAGESYDGILVFETWDDVFPSLFAWQPESNKLVMVDLGADVPDMASYTIGMDAPITWRNERGRDMASIEVTGVETGWEDYDNYYAPEPGLHYVAVSFTATNLSNSDVVIKSYGVSMLDSDGNNLGRSWARASEDIDYNVFSDDVTLAAGETYEGVVIFETSSDVTPSGLMWQPSSGLIYINKFNEDDLNASNGSDDTDTDAEATPDADAENEEEEEDTTSTDTGVTRSRRGSTEGTKTTETNTTETNTSETSGDAVTIHNAVDEELGTVAVVSTQDGWDEYHKASTPDDGEKFYLVTLDVNLTGNEPQYVGVLDFYLIMEDGSEVRADLFLNADDAEVKITESGQNLEAGDSATVVIPFLIPEDGEPVQIKWNTGVEEIVLDLAS